MKIALAIHICNLSRQGLFFSRPWLPLLKTMALLFNFIFFYNLHCLAIWPCEGVWRPLRLQKSPSAASNAGNISSSVAGLPEIASLLFVVLKESPGLQSSRNDTALKTTVPPPLPCSSGKGRQQLGSNLNYQNDWTCLLSQAHYKKCLAQNYSTLIIITRWSMTIQVCRKTTLYRII